MEKIGEAVEIWYEQFSRDLKQMQGTGLGQHHEKILLVAFLDALARTVYPEKGNRDRFVSLIESFTGWEEGGRVSLPHLKRLLEIVPDSEFEEARQFAISRLEAWGPEGEGPTGLKSLNQDPLLAEVAEAWPHEPGKRVSLTIALPGSRRVSLESLQHRSLLYVYRNALVHEAGPPGTRLEKPEFEFPYYTWDLSFDRQGERRRHWGLHYPLGFFRDLCREALEAVRDYLGKSDLDPMRIWEPGVWWISELNE